MLYTHAAAALLGAAIAAAAAWQVQDYRWDAKYQTLAAQYTQAQIESETAKREAEDDYTTRYTQALNAARGREASLRTARDAARAESDGLRGTLREADQRIASASESAVRRYAAAAGDVLAECSDRYTAVAAEADRHADDARTLIDAWPRH